MTTVKNADEIPISPDLRQHTTARGFWMLLLCAALAAYILPLGLNELRASDEAIFADIAADMAANGNWLTPHFQGNPCSVFPLYPWLAALCSGLQPPNAFTVRLPAMLAVFGLSAMAGLFAAKYRNRTAGFIAASIVLTSFAAMRTGITAQCETLSAFLLSAAWFSWYELGPQRQRWGIAWGIALLLVLVDMLNVGLKAPIFFYLPLLLTRMPPKTRRQLQTPAHMFWFISCAALFYLWTEMLCQQPILPWNTMVGVQFTEPDAGFFGHLFSFPLKMIAYLLPWGLLFWVPFCLALRPLEPAGSVASFLRAVVFCPFLYYLLMPGHSPLMLLPQLAPMAVLIALNAEVVIHRNERFFRRLSWILAGGAAAALIITAFICLRAACGHFEISDELCQYKPSIWIYLSLAALALVVACMTIRGQLVSTTQALPLAWSAVALRFLFFAACFPMLFFTLGDRQYIAAEIRSQGTSEWEKIDTLYLHSPDPFPAVCHYLDRPVKRVFRLEDELPQGKEDIYLLSYREPIVSHRTWIPVTGEVDFNLKRQLNSSLSIFKFTGSFSRTPAQETGLAPMPLRLYRGIHRE